MTAWKEIPQKSHEAERLEFAQLARIMMDIQLKSQKKLGTKNADRTLHAKSIAAASHARLEIMDDLAPELYVGFVKPGKSYPVHFRFSNASPIPQEDTAKDFRGLALRIMADEEQQYDLLATNFPVSHARDARQFVYFAKATAGGTISRIAGILGLMFRFGPFQTFRMLGNIIRGRKESETLALETYWSRGAITWGDDAVRYLLRPLQSTPDPVDMFKDGNYLQREFAARLANDDITFELCIQRFADEKNTPIENTAKEWREKFAPPIPVAKLVIPRRDLSTADAIEEKRRVEASGFNPWNTSEEFRPLGNLNRARKQVYDVSIQRRSNMRWHPERLPRRNRIVGGALRVTLRFINKWIPWHRLPLLLSLLNLDALRHDLRKHNLIDTEKREAPPQPRPVPEVAANKYWVERCYDGSHNDLSDDKMGASGTPFGRNMPPCPDEKIAEHANPIEVADKLMTRKSFIPASSLNILAAAWIQFQVHDWVAHDRHKLGKNDVKIPIPNGYPDWKNQIDGDPEREMRIGGNIPYGDGSNPLLFANQTSHWWDGSEVYGTDEKKAQSLREGAKLKLDNGYLPVGTHGFELTGFNESWWVGLSILHTLFAREHNLLCDELARQYPGMNDEQRYQRARLIVSALIAKIHTVEWTPALLGTEALDLGMNTNWFGPPDGDWLTKFGIWLTDVHALKGIPETFPDHHSAPYSLTEEFTTVYRMHPLLPDDYVLRRFETGEICGKKGFLDIQGGKADDVLREFGLRDMLYSFGIAHPGAITLNNFPDSLRHFEREKEIIDLAVVDIVRTRDRRVANYNDFRRHLRMPAIKSWDQMTANPETNLMLKDMYGDIEKVDTVIGLLGEAPPTGFAFSDTAFRIFILMASRRLQSDRFLNADFREDIYTKFGMDWIANTTMKSLILRHSPELAPIMPKNATAFAPWSFSNIGGHHD